MTVNVITDSTSYIPRALREELDIGVVVLRCRLDGADYLDDAEDCEPFFSALESSNSMPTTTQATPRDLAQLMEERVAVGHDVVGVFISARLSGTYESARLARELVLGRHPKAVIELVDGKSNSMELGFAVLAAARAAAAGEPVDRVVAAAESMIERTRFLFVPSTLEYLQRGGRIGRASALIGSVMQIRPILTASAGMTSVYARVRTNARALETILSTLSSDIAAKGGLGDVVVQHIHAEAAGRELVGRVSRIAGRAVELMPIGPVIGAHVGPGALGVAYHTVQPMMK